LYVLVIYFDDVLRFTDFFSELNLTREGSANAYVGAFNFICKCTELIIVAFEVFLLFMCDIYV